MALPPRWTLAPYQQTVPFRQGKANQAADRKRGVFLDMIHCQTIQPCLEVAMQNLLAMTVSLDRRHAGFRSGAAPFVAFSQHLAETAYASGGIMACSGWRSGAALL
jgi:hypothetical protein